MSKPKAKMVLIYAHEDCDFLKRSRFLGFLEGLARQEGWEFWWDNKINNPLFDEEIKQRLEEAEIIICLVSQPFLNSVYITNVESKIANARMRDEGILVVPVLLERSLAEHEEWLKDIHRFPEKGYVRTSRGRQAEIFAEITEYVRKWHKDRVLPFQDPQMLYTYRTVPDDRLKPEQKRVLRRDACTRARSMVPSEEKREKICEDARALINKNNNEPLGKEELKKLDKKHLAGKKRNPDPEIVRWVLRCCGLHPQGRVPGQRRSRG